MITITHSPGCIEVTGHAGYAEPGKDIVCAAISTLTQVFIASVELTTDKLNCVISAGNAVIRYDEGNLSERADVLIGSFFVGVEMIANEYPNHVKLSKH